MDKKNNKIISRILIPIYFLIGILLVAELVLIILKVPSYLIPKPTEVIKYLIINFSSLTKHFLITFLESFLGFLLGSVIGFVVAIIFAHNSTVERGLYPYAIALKTTPIVAIAPLLVLWFGNGLVSKVVTVSIICFFPVLVNVARGLKNVDYEIMDMFKSLNATKWQIFYKLRLPNSLPLFFSALKIGTSLAVIGAVVGEFAGANSGLGFLVLISSYRLETIPMFAAIFLSTLIGLILFLTVSMIEKKLSYWEKRDE